MSYSSVISVACKYILYIHLTLLGTAPFFPLVAELWIATPVTKWLSRRKAVDDATSPLACEMRTRVHVFPAQGRIQPRRAAAAAAATTGRAHRQTRAGTPDSQGSIPEPYICPVQARTSPLVPRRLGKKDGRVAFFVCCDRFSASQFATQTHTCSRWDLATQRKTPTGTSGEACARISVFTRERHGGWTPALDRDVRLCLATGNGRSASLLQIDNVIVERPSSALAVKSNTSTSLSGVGLAKRWKNLPDNHHDEFRFFHCRSSLRVMSLLWFNLDVLFFPRSMAFGSCYTMLAIRLLAAD